MKKLLVVMTVLMLSVNAAPNKDWYVGLGFISGAGEKSVISGSTNYDTSGRDIKFGVIFKSNNRFEFSASSIDINIGGSTAVTYKGRELDWIFTPNLNRKDGWFLPFLSAGFGRFTTSANDSTALSIQAAAGAYLMLSPVLELEFSYKKKAMGWSDVADSTDEMTNYYFGVKYKF